MKKNVIKSDRHAAIVANRIEKELRSEFDFLPELNITREKFGVYRVIKCHKDSDCLTSTFVRTAIECVEKYEYRYKYNGVFWNIAVKDVNGESMPIFEVNVWYKHEVK